MTIKELRKASRMTQKEFSKYLEISIRTLQDWEAGRRTPPDYVFKYVILMLQKIGCDIA